MAWHGIEGHDQVAEQFRRAIARGRLATSFLFAGPEGIGKRTFALKFAQALLCQTRPEVALDPCEQCPSCAQIAAQTHPDLLLVAKPSDRAEIPVRLLIGDETHRMQEGLCHDIGLKPFMGRRRVAIIDDADVLNEEGANCLLKTLEEPAPHSVLILITTSPAKQLPTIRSRCQLIRFQPLPSETVAGILQARGFVTEASAARRLARQSGGSVQRAVELADAELGKFRETLYRGLLIPVPDSAGLTKTLSELLRPLGDDAPARRARLRQVFGFAVELYRQLIRQLTGGEAVDDDLRPWLQRALTTGPQDVESAMACLDRCLQALDHMARNVNPATLIECWLDDLARITMAGRFRRPDGL